jgi:putative acetyltransferase
MASNADSGAIRAVVHAGRAEYSLVEPGRLDADLDDIEQHYLMRGGSFEVVVAGDGRIIGCAGLRPMGDRRAELCKMYLAKEARGRGLGRQLLENALAAARSAGFREVWAETNSVLTSAIRLYKRYGFELLSGQQLSMQCDEAYVLRLF